MKKAEFVTKLLEAFEADDKMYCPPNSPLLCPVSPYDGGPTYTCDQCWRDCLEDLKDEEK